MRGLVPITILLILIGAVPGHTDNTLNSQLDQLVKQLITSQQGLVVLTKENDIYLNLGQEQGVKEGDRFDIVRKGEPIKVAGETIGYEETPIATVEVGKTREKVSLCTVVDSLRAPEIGDVAYLQGKKINRLVIGQFSYNQGFNQLTKSVQEKLVTAMTNKGIQVVERDQLERVLSEQKLGYSGLINIESAKKIGELLGAEGIVLGTVNDMGNSITLNGRLIDIGTGDAMRAAEVDMAKTPFIVQLLDAAVAASAGYAGPKSPAVATASAKKKPQQEQVQVKEGIEFVIEDCRKAGQSITCNYTVTNKGNDAPLVCSSKYSKIHDNFGNSYWGSQVKLANCQESEKCWKELVAEVPTVAAVTFEGVDEGVTSLPKISLGCAKTNNRSYWYREIFNIEHRNISLTE